ncbi:MAG: hypothetical protein O7A63_08460 [Acidobacteria bacterium]|nr:hypothetical protein [Acidobacteriota bacterium]
MNSYLAEGRRALEENDWVQALRSLSWAHDVDPDDVEVYLTLIESYERCASVEDSPDVLQQAFNVCRELRDRRLTMTPAEQRRFYDAFVRVRDGIVEAGRKGWSPPPPKERVHELFEGGEDR